MDIAITGMAVLFPGAADLEAYWNGLVTGADAITDVPAHRWDPAYFPDRVYCRRGGFVDDLAAVDVTRFGVMPGSVPGTDPDQLIALSVAARALADAGGQERLPDRERVGVVLGRGGYLTPGQARHDQRVRTAGQLTRTLGELLPELGADHLARIRDAFAEQLGPEVPEAAIGLVPNLVASRIANRLDLRGPAYTTDAACASSLIAVDQAAAELTSGRCDLMLAGGVHHCHDITLWTVFSQLGALSRSQRSRPFHAGADGILIGEGTGIVVLKRLADAVRDGDRVYAVIRGTGVAADGRGGGLVSPDPVGQTRAVRQAWAAAGLDPAAPDAIGLIEAHGTGTPAGDAAELATLAEVFGPPAADAAPAVIGSVKSMIGHTMPAAGAAGLIKAALAIHRATLLPTLHCDDPHPDLARTRFAPLATARPWEAEVRRAAVNAFGFGGINAHAVLEQAPGSGPISRGTAAPIALVTAGKRALPATATTDEPVLRLAADTPAALAALLDAPDAGLISRCGTEPGPGRVRLGVVAPDARRLATARRAVARGKPWRGKGDVWFTPEPLLAPGTGKLAFVFPGLEAEFDPQVDEVAEHFGLPRPGAADVGDVARHGLGVLGVGRVLDAALRKLGLVPDAVAGHSIGEWSAMYAGGLYDDAAADELLGPFDPDSLRVPGVVFAAIGAPANHVESILNDRTDIVLSHDNAPGQSMICGPESAVAELVADFRAERIIAQLLPFRSGFHTPMLKPYLGPLTEGVRRTRVRPARIPVWSGTTASPYPEGTEAIRDLFVRHLLEPVRFRPLIEAMYAAGFRAFVQVGTGQLTSLISDTLQGRDFLAIAANSPRRGGLAQLHRVSTALWTEGRATDTRDRASAPVRLDLGGALVSLPTGVRDELRSAIHGATGPNPAPDPLAAHTDRHPVAAQLRAALAETAASAAAVLTATRPPEEGPEWSDAAEKTQHRAAADHNVFSVVSRNSGPGPRTHRETITVSIPEMPHLLDHCFIPQQPNWPDLSDRRPVVPATTIVQLMMDAAERAHGGRAIGVHDVRLEQWLGAEEPTDVDVTVTPTGDVTFGPYARATVELAQTHPTPPAPWRPDGRIAEPCQLTAADLYRDRWMFHGPAFQGVTDLIAIGDTHIRGTITTPAAPGALLDNVGQILGYWILAKRSERNVVFPVRMRGFRFYGPQPEPATEVDCRIRITSVTGTALTADVQLSIDGKVWAEIAAWQDRRFTAVSAARPGGYPEHRTLAAPQPGGWVLLADGWPDLASRDLVMRTHLGAAERAAYESHPPRGRRQWLLGRIAAKDAVRQWLWTEGGEDGPIFPAEIAIHNTADGRPYPIGHHRDLPLPPLSLSLAHRGDAAVALVRPGKDAETGIDIELISDRAESTYGTALGPRERDLLAERASATSAPEALWFTRFWAAKEAAAKAEGTGLRGRPRDYEVVEAEPYALVVKTPRRTHHVRLDHVTTETPGAPSRGYVVAWTTKELFQ